MDDKLPIIALENPSIESSVAMVKDALAQRRGLVLIGRCWAEYQGRARSILESGERLVVIKEDGTVLVHRPKGYEPVNWQPPKCYFRINIVDGNLVIEAIRHRVQESLKIIFNQIYVLLILDLVDKGAFYLHVSEKEIQKAILSKPELIEEGFKPISYEKSVDPGFIDVYGIDKNGRLVVIEIKRVRVGKEAVMQLAKYVEYVKANARREVRGVLAAPNISKGVQKLFTTLGLEYKKIDLKECAMIITTAKERSIQDFF